MARRHCCNAQAFTKPNSCNNACRVIWDEIKKSVSNLDCPPAAAGRLGNVQAFSSMSCLHPAIKPASLTLQQPCCMLHSVPGPQNCLPCAAACSAASGRSRPALQLQVAAGLLMLPTEL